MEIRYFSYHYFVLFSVFFLKNAEMKNCRNQKIRGVDLREIISPDNDRRYTEYKHPTDDDLTIEGFSL